MFKHRRNISSLESLIRQQKVTKKDMAKRIGITPQWLSILLRKDTKDLTIRQLEQIMTALNLNMIVSIEDIIV